MPQISLLPPLAGTVRSVGFQQEPPFTSYSSLNFWPIDVKTGRAVSAVRPGLVRFSTHTTQVNLVQPIAGIRSSYPVNSFVVGVNGQLSIWNGTSFTNATGAQAASLDTDRALYPAPIIQKVLIPTASAKPIIFDYSDGTAATVVESAGTCPSDCRFAAHWQGAVWISGRQDSEPHVLYACRVGDVTDWDFSVDEEDTGGAFATTSAEFNGILSGPVTALAPVSSDVMLVSTLGGTFALRGHPRLGGQFEPLTDKYMLGQGAWAKAPDGSVYFMTALGMMKLQPFAGAAPTLISRNRIPEELIGLEYDPADPKISMEYDSRWNGIFIFNREDPFRSWLYDLQAEGFHEMDFPVDVYVAKEVQIDDVLTDQTSGVLCGSSVGLLRFDKFGVETINSGLVVGPVRISNSLSQKSHIDQMTVVFGRDTPGTDVGGELRVAVGRDGQDAISHIENGTHQFATDLTTLGNNNGVCYPSLSGNAIAVAIDTTQGDVSVEEINVTFTPAGNNNLVRTTQLSVDGDPSAIAEGDTGFSAGTWYGYSSATPAAPDEALSDYTTFVDLSTLPSTWWAEVSADGGDIRVTDASNNRLPLDLIEFDKSASTGILAYKSDVAATPTAVRIWCGKIGASQPDPDDTYGAYDAYDRFWRVFWPSGGGTDNTQYQNDADNTPQITEGDVTGTIGFSATDFTVDDEAVAQVTDMLDDAVNASLAGLDRFTMIAVSQQPSGPSQHSLPVVGMITNLSNNFLVKPRVSAGSDPNAFTEAVTTVTTAATAQSSTSGAATGWHHFAGVWNGTASRIAYFDGGGKVTDNTSKSLTLAASDTFSVGGFGGVNGAAPIYACMAQFHATVRNDAWISYQADMLDQSTFWGSWTAFQPINDEPSPIDDPDNGNQTACPNGEVAVTETGTWAGYDSASVPSGATALSDFTVFIDLGTLSSTWWSNVDSTGVDIRATDQDNLFLPIDLISIDANAQTGLAAVRLLPNDSTPTSIRLWVGNGSAVSLPACGAYGQYATYSTDYLAFWPEGAGNDRTQFQNNLTSNNGLDPGDTAGPIGNTGTTYTAAEDDKTVITDPIPYASVSMTVSDGDNWSAVAAAYAEPRTTWHQEVAISVGDRSELSGQSWAGPTVFIESQAGAARRLVARNTRNGFSSFGYSSVSLSEATWTAIAGGMRPTSHVFALVGDSTSATLTTEQAQTVTVQDVFLGGGEKYRQWVGRLSLVSIIDKAISDEWVKQYEAMLDQSTFWGTWSWTASSSSLPQ